MSRSSSCARSAWPCWLALAACAAPAEEVPATGWDALPEVQAPTSELASLPSREAQYERLCALPRSDSFFRRLCGAARPELTSLSDLIRVAGLDVERAFALTANSTSLVSLSVSALNPRLLLFPRVDETLTPAAEFTALSFVRGEPFAELVSRDSGNGELNFYLLSFERGCDYDGSCDRASLFSEEIERGWTAYSVYSEEDLENTSLDCRSCHQPGGYGTAKILRMQELSSPWLHWFPQRFVQRTDSDRLLTAQFLEMHDVDQQYGGVPIATIESAIDEGGGALLEAAIRSEGFATQPNVFDPRIEAEAKNGEPSSTWLGQFDLALRGEAIAVPYPRADVTDAAKRAAVVEAYRAVVTGTAPRESMPDVRDVLSQDALEKLGLVPQPAADGRATLVQMCSRCHDGRGNPSITRNRFNVRQLEQLPRDEKDLAIARMQLPSGSEGKMPPERAGRMTDAAIQAAISELSK